MLYTIENASFRLSADTMGAELNSFTANGREYIRQKNDVWGGQSPLLFPVVGKLKDDLLKVGGKTFAMPKHGFAKNSDFALESKGEECMTFLLKSSEATLACYPFDFELRVTYALTESGFTMNYSVKNAGAEAMYFSIGAHPGFFADAGDELVFDSSETAPAWLFGSAKLIGRKLENVFENGNTITLRLELFRDDALIFEGLRSSGVTLKRGNGRNVHVDFGGAPCLGIWAKPASDYVCIEPWYGVDDREDADYSFENKPHVQKLDSGKEFKFTVSAEV